MTQTINLSQVREATAKAAPMLVLTHRTCGELRIAPRVDWLCTSGICANAAQARTRAESIAYYTDNRPDAILTACRMARALRLEVQHLANHRALQESPA